jgi:tRNA (mo5U34)-methyltransferase
MINAMTIPGQANAVPRRTTPPPFIPAAKARQRLVQTLRAPTRWHNEVMLEQSLAGNEDYRRRVQQEAAYLSSKGWYHTIELPGGEIIQGLHPIETLREKLNAFQIPPDLRGKTVLDIGAWTGWYSFELERRGARVTAMDCIAPEEFFQARRLLNSNVEHLTLDVDELSPQTAGTFDYVLFFGVLYHLRHPLLALEKVCSVTREAAFVESYVIDGANPAPEGSGIPNLLEFYETDELGGQLDNWYGPNTKCLLALCRSAGFARVRLEKMVAGRACVSCWRRWDPPPGQPSEPPPTIQAAVNNRTHKPQFHHGKDEYVCCYFRASHGGLAKEQVFVEVDGYGVPSLFLKDFGDGGYQLNFRCPPWLEPGRHEVRLRTTDSHYSEPVHIEKR